MIKAKTVTMKKLLMVVIVAVSAWGAAAQTEIKAWSRLIGANNYDLSHGMAVAPSGNVFVGGPKQSCEPNPRPIGRSNIGCI